MWIFVFYTCSSDLHWWISNRLVFGDKRRGSSMQEFWWCVFSARKERESLSLLFYATWLNTYLLMLVFRAQKRIFRSMLAHMSLAYTLIGCRIPFSNWTVWWTFAISLNLNSSASGFGCIFSNKKWGIHYMILYYENNRFVSRCYQNCNTFLQALFYLLVLYNIVQSCVWFFNFTD